MCAVELLINLLLAYQMPMSRWNAASLYAALSDGRRRIAAMVDDDCREPRATISVSGKACRVPNDRWPILCKLVQEVAAVTNDLPPTPD